MTAAGGRTGTTVRVGVWGVGVWGEKHARVYHELPKARLAGIFDRDAERARAVAERYGVPAFDSADALLEACEAVSVAVATVAHRAATEQALAAGCHVLVEKPMAVTVAEADSMIAAAGRAGRVLQVGQVERFNPALIAGRSQIRDPKFIEGHRLALFQPRSLDIDVVSDLMIHDLDIVLDSVDSPLAQLSAVGVAVLSQSEDIANVRLEFENGCVANLTASRVSQDRLRRIRFFQADGYLSLDLYEKTADLVRLDLAAVRAAPGDLMTLARSIRRGRLEVPAGEPLALELAAFLGSLSGNEGGAAPARAGREALRVAEEVRSAMRRRATQWALP